MATVSDDLQSLHIIEKSSKDFVYIKDYGLTYGSPVTQKLSPLDMNMPRLYGSRWILCFPLSADADNRQV